MVRWCDFVVVYGALLVIITVNYLRINSIFSVIIIIHYNNLILLCYVFCK